MALQVRAGSRSGALRWQYRHSWLLRFRFCCPRGPVPAFALKSSPYLPSGLPQHFTVWTGIAVVRCVHRVRVGRTFMKLMERPRPARRLARVPREVPLQYGGAPTALALCAPARPHARRPPPLSSILGTARVPLGYPSGTLRPSARGGAPHGYGVRYSLTAEQAGGSSEDAGGCYAAAVPALDLFSSLL